MKKKPDRFIYFEFESEIEAGKIFGLFWPEDKAGWVRRPGFTIIATGLTLAEARELAEWFKASHAALKAMNRVHPIGEAIK